MNSVMEAASALAPAYLGRPALAAPRAAAPELAAMVVRLRQSELFRAYQLAFQNLTGLPLALRAAGSFQAPLHGSNRSNPFCDLMGKRNDTCSACLIFQKQLETEAELSPRTLECYAGLSESAVPVRAGAVTFAYLQTGQVMLRRPSRARFARLAAQLAKWKSTADLAQLKSLYFLSPVMGVRQYASVLSLLEIFGQHLSVVSNQVFLRETPTEPRSVSRARQYIADHHTESLSMPQVAQSVHMSAYYFCKVFRKATGLTFTAYLARLRIEFVKALLMNPQTRISEAAYDVGFQSLSQFNRVFRRVAGEAPTDFRLRQLGSGSAS